MAFLADVIVPEIFQPYSVELTATKSLVFSSGLVERGGELDRLAGGGGTNVIMPFFQDLSGDSLVWDETAETPGIITTAQDVAVIQYRKKAWNSTVLAKYKSGDDPQGVIMDLVARYWAREYQTMLINILNGVFASTVMASEHVHDVALEDGNAATAAELMSRTNAVTALSLLGDEINGLGFVFMHGDVYWNLVQLEEINFLLPSEIDTTLGGPDTQVPTYLGKIVIVDDTLPKVAGLTSGFKYTTIFAGPGAVGYGEAALDPQDAVKTDENVLAGIEFMINRRVSIIHPFGVRWIGTPAGAAPTNAELATGGNWERIYERKNVRLVAAITNG